MRLEEKQKAGERERGRHGIGSKWMFKGIHIHYTNSLDINFLKIPESNNKESGNRSLEIFLPSGYNVFLPTLAADFILLLTYVELAESFPTRMAVKVGTLCPNATQAFTSSFNSSKIVFAINFPSMIWALLL